MNDLLLGIYISEKNAEKRFLIYIPTIWTEAKENC